MNVEKLFEGIFIYEDSDTGLYLDSFVMEEVNCAWGHFKKDGEPVGVVYFDYLDDKDTLLFKEINLAEYSGNGVLTRFANHVGNAAKENEVKYISFTVYNGAITVAARNGMKENNQHDQGNMIIDMKKWNNAN